MVQQKYAKKGWYCCCHLLVLFFVFFIDKLNIYELNCHWSLEDPLQSSIFFYANQKSKMFKCETKLHDCSLDGPLQSLDFLFNMEFKMAAMAWLGLTSDPMGKMF